MKPQLIKEQGIWQIKGDVTLETLPNLKKQLPHELIERLNLAGLQRVDSAIVLFLLTLEEAALQENWRLYLEAIPAKVQRLLEVYQVAGFFDLGESRGD